MQIPVKTLHAVIDMLAEKTDCSRDFSGLRMMCELIGLQNSDYLYMKIYRLIKSRTDGTIGLNPYNLNEIAKYLNYKSFRQLELSLGNVTPQAKSLAGSYYCYVRANLPKPAVLKSPVHIVERDGRMWFELKGPRIQYKGEIAIRDGCMFVLMSSKAGKEFHHVYKVGTTETPMLLQGVFSGVSTAFDPIGGRTVLMRQDDGSKLKNEMQALSKLKLSKVESDRVLAKYFLKSDNNNVVPGRSSGFSIDDLS
jgi:hypothetical protein